MLRQVLAGWMVPVVGLLAWCGSAYAANTDVTPTSTTYVWDWRNVPTGNEGINRIHDGSANTKLYIGKSWDCIEYTLTRPATVAEYRLTSANDFPARDPKDWRLEGSVDGIGWTVLDTQTNQTFPSRYQMRSFTVASPGEYLYYRLYVVANNGANDFQLAEFRILGAASAGILPGATALDAVASGAAITLSWAALPNATGYYVQRLEDDGSGTIEAFVPAGGTTYVDEGLATGTTYLYQVQAVNGTLRSLPSGHVHATTAGSSAELDDITDHTSLIPTAQYAGVNSSESISKVTDNNPFTKYCRTGQSSLWIQFRAAGPVVVTQYALTSANDSPDRDPRSWVLQGSNTSNDWNNATTLDARANQTFIGRHQRRVFTFENDTPFTYYRLSITNNGSGDTQLAEWELLSPTVTPSAAPATPTGLQATALSGNQIKLTWNDTAGQLNPERYYRIEQARDAGFTVDYLARTTGANSTEFRATGLTANTTYYFRVTGMNEAGASNPSATVARATNTSNDPPTSYPENGWYDHWGRTMIRNYLGNNVAVYFDDAVPTPYATWMNAIMERAFAHCKATYGSFGDDHLYVLCDAPGNGFEGGGIQNQFDSQGYYRNMVFVVSGNWADSSYTGWNLNALTHELGHIIEGSNNSIKESPTFGVWGDSKWCEIFQYDLYVQMPDLLPSSATYAYNHFRGETDDWGHYWFRDWYYPLYAGQFENTVQGPAFLAGYFNLLAEYFPQISSHYARSMNLGEYVHFCAGAAGVDLLDQARVAFKLTPQQELQYFAAQREFPEVTALYTAPPVCAGDANCDGAVTFADIDAFVARLGCPQANPDGCATGCPWLAADVNGDGAVTFADIDPFVSRLGATCN